MNGREWLESQKTPDEEEMEARWLHKQLLEGVRDLVEKWGCRAKQGNAETHLWIDRYRAVQARLEAESGAEAYQRLKAWLKENKPTGPTVEWLKWERAYFAISNCGKEYIGWSATCCSDRTKSIAVPIGCNHRLCPLCAYRRSQLGRVRIKTMFDRMANPVMVTVTEPNVPELDAAGIKRFRGQVTQWLRQRTVADLICECGHERDAHKEPGPDGKLKRVLLHCRECDCQQWRPRPVNVGAQHEFLGGVYSMEVTYSRRRKSWHIHAHCLADLNFALPERFVQEGARKRENRVEFYGKKLLAFTALKWRMEFDWLQLTGGKEEWGVRPKNDPPKKSFKAKVRWRAAWELYWKNFERWVLAKRDFSTKQFKVKHGWKYVVRDDLTPAETAEYLRREEWNRRNTRVFHIQPVDDRDGAAREVLKYITKVANFSDRPDSIEEFSNATRSARMVQTFGTWYGFAVDVEFDPNHLEDWGRRPDCACGLNHWEKIGSYRYDDCERDESGRLLLRETVLKHDHGGTVARPRTRAGDRQRSGFDDRSENEWQSCA